MTGINRSHPAAAFIFFCRAVFFSMVFMHPVLVCINLVCSFLCCAIIAGKELSMMFRYYLFMGLLLIVLNPIVNTNGVTVLFRYFGRKFTLEGLVYGVVLAGLMISCINWFTCMGKVITTEKFSYLFSRRFPALCTVFTMTIGMIPFIQSKLADIAWVRQCLHDSKSSGLSGAARDMGAAVNYAFEKAVNISRTMKNRGFASTEPTRLTRYSLSGSDFFLLAVTAAGVTATFSSVYSGGISVTIVPRISFHTFEGFELVCLVIYVLFLLVPVIMWFAEELRWKYLRSKI